MAFLFRKFQEGVKVLAKRSIFVRDPRQLQFEADINRLFLYTSYNRLGMNADQTDAEEIIEMAGKTSLSDQQTQVQDNIHCQGNTFCRSMDDILLPGFKHGDESLDSSVERSTTPRRSGLSHAIGQNNPSNNHPPVSETKTLTLAELSQRLKDIIGYTLEIKPSLIPHKEAGEGLFIDGEAGVGSVIAFYPGVIYSPAYYRYIPGYPRVDADNPYLITRYDGTVINAQPWGAGGETREAWDGLRLSSVPKPKPSAEGVVETKSDQIWKVLNEPLESTSVVGHGDVLERRNPLAFAHFANHPPKGVDPNVMVCPYDFPLTEKDMRTYIPNVKFGNNEVKMRRFGSFWFKSGGSGDSRSNIPVLKALVLVATRTLCDEEVLLNYRLSNSKRRPSWYAPVDEEEDKRRWS